MGRKSYLGGSSRIGHSGMGPGEFWSTRNRALEKQGGYNTAIKRAKSAKGANSAKKPKANKPQFVTYFNVRKRMLKLNFQNYWSVAEFLIKLEHKKYFAQLIQDPVIVARYNNARRKEEPISTKVIGVRQAPTATKAPATTDTGMLAQGTLCIKPKQD